MKRMERDSPTPGIQTLLVWHGQGLRVTRFKMSHCVKLHIYSKIFERGNEKNIYEWLGFYPIAFLVGEGKFDICRLCNNNKKRRRRSYLSSTSWVSRRHHHRLKQEHFMNAYLHEPNWNILEDCHDFIKTSPPSFLISIGYAFDKACSFHVCPHGGKEVL